MSEAARCSQCDSEIDLPVFPRIGPYGLNGPYLGVSVEGGLVLGLFMVKVGYVSTI